MNRSRYKGLHYEAEAKQYLLHQGLTYLAQNYRCRFGEIDLVMHDVDFVCFIEVKFRKNLDFGGAVSAIVYSKQRRIIKTAQTFMQNNSSLKNLSMRFDALIIQQCKENMTINWIQHAFYANSDQ